MSCPWAKIKKHDTLNLEEIMYEEVKKRIKPEQKQIHENNSNSRNSLKTVDIPSKMPNIISNLNEITFGRSQTQNEEFKDLSGAEEEEDTIEVPNSEKDTLEHEFNSFPKNGYKINRREKIMTQYDVVLSGRNDSNVAYPEFHFGKLQNFDWELSNNLIKSLNISPKHIKARQIVGDMQKRLVTSEAGGLDEYTCHILSEMVYDQLIQRINDVVSNGKEAVLLHAELGPSYPFIRNLPNECVIKIFKRKTLDEYTPESFIKYSHIFREEGGKHEREKSFALWAGNEMSNLKKLLRAGVRCPKVIKLRNHILVMSFIGNGRRPASKLKDAVIMDADGVIAYNEVINGIRDMYQKANVIHADLSVNSILWHDGHCYFIDLSQSVNRSHKHAMYLLYRDCSRITDFFINNGVPEVLPIDELFKFVTG